MYQPPRSPEQPGSSSPIVNDKPFSAGCVFWFAVVGFVLTMLVVTAGKSAGMFNLSTLFSKYVDPAWMSDLFTPSTTTTTTQEFETVTLSGTLLARMYRLEVVRTDATRQQGLSDRLSLPAGTGMHFIFDTPSRYTFWMHGMHFPLDMVFLDGGKIVNIANNVPYPKTPTAEPATVRPQQPFDQVLELPAGDADRLGLRIGQVVSFPLSSVEPI